MTAPDMAHAEKVNHRHRMPSCCKRSLLFACLLGGSLTMSACSDEPSIEASAPAQPATAPAPHLHALPWLKRTDPTDADVWLASREAGRDLDPLDPAVSEMHRRLEVAGQRFRDHPRMIANRAVQLEAMLKEKGIDEHAPNIIDTLCGVPGDRRYVESFSSLTQQYYNLRLEGLDKAKAVEALRKLEDPA